jgi:hypothetical protein
MRWEVLALCTFFAALLWYLYQRGHAAVKARRGAMFAGCLPLFETYRVTQDDVYYPTLRGQYRGYAITLEPVVDHIGVRKIPSLWLLATVHAKVPFGGVLDFLVRPHNVEFYSPAARLAEALPVPPGWPPHAWLRTDDSGHMPPSERLTPHIGFFSDPRAKELLVTPNGVRLVYQLGQSARAHYMVLRHVRFENLVIAEERVRDLLDRAIAIHEDLRREDASVAQQAPTEARG